MNKEQLEQKAYAYALKNALAYKGTAKQGAVISALFHEGFSKEDMKKYSKKISKIVKKVNSMSEKQQEKEFEKLEKEISHRKERQGLPELPDTKNKKIKMRFAPSASGPLHIGHAITACYSFLYTKKYRGKFYIRIEDTNPENIFPESYKMIKRDAKYLFKKTPEIVIQSDKLKLHHKYAEKLIKKNKAYVCTCPHEKFKNLIDEKKNCSCRKLSEKENLERWKKMLSKTKNNYKQGEAVLRFKSSMKHKNPAMRDFPLARINTHKHPKQGKKYRVWPLMNLAVAVDDLEMKMTHVIRGKDHRDNALRQEMIHKALNKKSPWTAFIGRIKFKDLELSTTKIKKKIEQGEYSGWDDKRLPTLISLKKQGYNAEAFWKLSEHLGLNEVDKVIDKKEFFRLLDVFNREAKK